MTNNSRPLSLLFFTRGRGRGHAVPDIAIAEELPGFLPDFNLRFASYGTGAETLRDAGYPLADLNMADDNHFVETLQKATALIREVQPDVVIAHEEYAVVPAARAFGVPSIFVTDWFPSARTLEIECIHYVDSIVFIGNPGIFPVPPLATARPIYVGPVVRKMKYTLVDQPRARQELSLPQEALVLSVIPGAWATEERSPLWELLRPAFEDVKWQNEKVLLWAAASDYDTLLRQCASHSNVRILRCARAEQLMVASDLAITKGNRGSIMDLASLGIPSISISSVLNPIDEALVARVRSNLALNVNAVDSRFLARCIEDAAGVAFGERDMPLNLHLRGGEVAAEALADEILRLVGHNGGAVQ